MEINKKIFDYAFCGIPFNKDRSVITTLENVLMGVGVRTDYSFDFETSDYFIVSERGALFIAMGANIHATRIIVSPYEYLCILLNQEIDLNWFKQLKEGDSVTIGKCHTSEYYPFNFDTNLVRKFFGKEVTISEIISTSIPSKPGGYFNGDTRGYRIEEIGQFLPSSVFIPQFMPPTPIEKVVLRSLPISDFSFLK